jgi:hypothetical protein
MKTIWRLIGAADPSCEAKVLTAASRCVLGQSYP